MDAPLTVSLPGVALHARRGGHEPFTVLLHGFGSDLRTWDPLLAALDGRLSTLRYDLRGFGRSRWRGEEPFSHADDLLALLDALDIERCDVVGVSMGAGIALHAALEQPRRFARLVLISPAIMAWEWSQPWRERWREIVAEARAGRLDRARELWWLHPLFDSTRHSAAGPLLKAAIMAYSGDEWLRDMQRQELPDVERLHRLAVPTLLLSGGRDLEDFRLMADLLEASTPLVRRRHFPDLGHLLHLEDPNACASAILQALSTAATADGGPC